jgi:hypothetical protein
VATAGARLSVAAVFISASSCGDVTVPVLTLDRSGPPGSGAVDSGPPANGGPPLGSAPDGATAIRLRYEAEALPPNVLIQTALADNTCFATNLTCPDGGVQEGANCCSGGGVVTELLGRAPCDGPPGSTGDYQNCQTIGGGVEFEGVTVPADGTYDVTWWYHCGLNSSYGDAHCGGVHYAVGSSCRPHLIDVNGVPMSSTVAGQTATIYQFPCYPGAWSIVHGATTALPLKAGSNTISIHAPHAVMLDASDIDAIDVQPAGRGAPPLVTPVVSGS